MGMFLELPCDNKMEFTDRISCRRMFWEIHDHMLDECGEKNRPFRVINYYGIGGVGKSRLNEYLMDQLDRKSRTIHVNCNLKESHDQLSVLRQLSNQLRRKGIAFLLYDYARYRRSELIGDGVELMDKKTIIESSPLLSEVFDFCSCIPLVSDLTDPAKYMIDGFGRIRHLFNENRDILKRIDTMKAGELYESLPALFAYDMNKSLARSNRVLVVFLDTYEALVNYTNAFDDALSKDMWLRDHRYGLVARSEGVLWVLSGRNELRWKELHTFWTEDDRLQTMPVGDLSREDTYALLAAEVDHAELKEHIYQLSNGTPLYLELCIGNYQDACRAKGTRPDREEIGRNKASLVERYVQYRNHGERELLQILASFGIWTSDELERFKNRYYPNISDISLENVVHHSYVTKLDGGRYKIHDTVSDGVLADYAGNVEKVKHRVSVFKAEDLERMLEDTKDRELFVPRLEAYIRCKLVMLADREAFEAFYMQVRNQHLSYLKDAVQYLDMAEMIYLFVAEAEAKYPKAMILSKLYEDYSARLWKAGLYKQMVAYADRSVRIIDEYFPEMSVAWSERAFNYARILSSAGHIKEALTISEEVLEVRRKKCGADHPDTLDVMANCAIYQYKNGAYKSAVKTAETVLALRKRVLGEMHAMTIESINDLSIIYGASGDYQKALDFAKQAVDLSREVQGETDPKTLEAMTNLSNHYGRAGLDQEALSLAEKIVECRKEYFGDEHPDTLGAQGNLANRYQRVGRLEEALALSEKLLIKEQRILGKNHPRTMKTMNNLSVRYMMMGRGRESAALSEEVLELRKQILGQNHPDTIQSMVNLSTRYWKIQKKTEAYLLLKKAAALQKNAIGKDHPETRRTLKLLAKMIRYR